jgi:DNA-binding transcriptional LysR family regulator
VFLATVGLVLTDRLTHFLDDQVDVALRIGALPDSSLVATRLGTVRHVVRASPDYLAANGTPVTLDDLARHSVILFQNTSALSTWDFQIDGVAVAVSFRMV